MEALDVNPLIALWLTSSLLGLAVSAYGLRDAMLDLNALGVIKNGRRLVARQRVLAQGIRSVAFFLWSVVGFLAIGSNPSLSFVVLVLVFTNIGYTALSISDAYTGWRLRNG